MNVENTSTEGVTDLIKVEIKVENESDDEVESEIELYRDHAIKEEMVVRPAVFQEIDVTYCPEDLPVPKKRKLEATDEETDQVKPENVKKEDNIEGIITNVDCNSSKNIKTDVTFVQNNCNDQRPCNQTPGVSNNVFKCKECPKTFSKRNQLTKHVIFHKKELSCSACEYKCARKVDLISHLRTHTGEKPYLCTHCDFKCSAKGNLSVHLRIHTGEKPYSCSYCEFKCNQKGVLSRHERIHSSEKRINTDEKLYLCSYCDYKSDRNLTMATHLRTHTGEKPFSCPHCDYKCSTKSNLTVHLRIHTGEKPYSCSHCDYKCMRKRDLTTHLRVHTGEK